jgi:LAGLIDADG endonuclease
MLLGRPRAATRPRGAKRLQDRLPGLARVRGDAGRVKRPLSPRAARLLRSGRGVVNRRYDNHREHLYRYSVTRRQDLLERIIPFFEEHPLRSAKRLDFEKFALCVRRMAAGHHKTCAGLADIVEIMQTMNRKKPRHDLIRILRDYTPEALDTGS